MATQKEITATEKLLEFIRTSPPPAAKNQDLSASASLPSGIEIETPPDKSPVPEQNDPPPSAPSEQDETDDAGKGRSFDPPDSLGQRAQELPPKAIPLTQSRPQPPAPKQSAFLDAARELFGEIAVGIDIQPNELLLIKVIKTKTSRKVIAHQRVQFDAETKDIAALCQDQHFRGLLSQTLAAFCSNNRSPEIWCSAAQTQFSIHNIIIPKLPPQEIPKAVFWSTKREVEFEEKDTLLDFSILKEFEEGGQPKIQILVTLVPNNEVTAIKNLFQGVGFPLTGFTFPAAAMQNIFEADTTVGHDEAIVYFNIQRSRSTIDLFYQGKMLFSREIKTGADSFIESAIDYANSQKISLTDIQARQWIFHTDTAAAPFIDAEREISTELDIDSLPVIDRLARQLSRTFEYCVTHFKVPQVTKLYTSGLFVLHDSILKQVEKSLAVRCAVLAPLQSNIFSFQTPLVSSATASLVTASGLALSQKSKTKNFLYTYKERQQEKTSNRINAVIAVTTLFAVIFCAAFSFHQYRLIHGKKLTIISLNEQLSRNYLLSPRSQSPKHLIDSIAKIKEINRQNSETVSRFQIIGIIQEATSNAPPEVQLTNFSLSLHSETEKGKKTTKDKEPISANTLQMTGFVKAPKEQQEFVLLKFIKILLSKKLITNPILLATEQGTHEEAPTLDFKIQLTPVADF